MFKRISSTKSTRKNTKAVVKEAPAKTEQAEKPIVEEKEPVSESRGEDATRQSDPIETLDNVISKAEKTACANDTVRGAMAYALAQGREGDAIDQVFSKVEDLTCAPENELIANIKQCKITKFSKEEKVGISLRTSISTDGLYVNSIAAGSKFESTELAIGLKVLKINGEACPAALADAIGMLKSAESTLILEVGPNDEAAYKLKEMGEIETEHNDLVAKKKTQVTEIAVDGYADSCGFFWSLQNGLCALQDTDMKAIEPEQPVEESPKEEVKKPEMEDKALADEVEEEAPKQKKKKSLLPSLKLRRTKSKSKKAVQEPAIEEEKPVEEAPKEEEEAKVEELPKAEEETKPEEAPKVEEEAKPVTEEKEAPKVEEEKEPVTEEKEPTKEAEEEAKPEETEEKAAPKEEALKEKKKKTFFKAPSMPSIKLRKNKSKKVVEEVEEPSPVETVTGEDGLMTIKFTKVSLDESVGLALRNSVLNDCIYVYGIFEGSKLKSSGMVENMRVHTINGESFSNVEKAVKVIKEASELEIVAGPNDEPEEPEEEEEEEEEPKETSGSWFQLW